MVKLHAILLITVITTILLFLLVQIRIHDVPSFEYAKSNWVAMVLQRIENTEEDVCAATIKRITNTSIQVKGHKIHFATNNKWNAAQNLNVFVILHSHVDPGWLETFENYYKYSSKPVRNIINNVVNALTKYPKLRFIWSEVSFLERWWSEANETYRKNFQSLVDEGRLEITGGSWVMIDEATPYFWAAVDNMIVGHQYVQKTLNVTPTTSWSVDPFGHGLMVPYLLALSGIERLVIGRINSYIKDKMKQHHQLQFRWAQTWDLETRWAPFVNVLPNLYYTVVNACGSDGKICCQFDVSKSARTTCNERARVDTEEQIALYAKRMAEQYRSLQSFYNSSTILIAAGDDFLYSDPEDLEIVHRVYSTLFDYINENQEQFHMNVQFGTVADYFNALNDTKDLAPILDGDFFPYMDIALSATPFWTGFYNHRAYFKRFERIVQSELRSLDLLSVAVCKKPNVHVEKARRNLALSQHHDAITGTSTREVMNDYAARLRSALRIILMEKENLLNDNNSPNFFTTVFNYNFSTSTGMFLQRRTLSFAAGNESYDVKILNQKSFQTMELIKLNVSTQFIVVKQNGKLLPAQIVPLADQNNLFELSFFVVLQPFGALAVSVQGNAINPEPRKESINLFGKNSIRSKKMRSDDRIVLTNNFFTLYWSTQINKNHRIVYNDGSIETEFTLNFKYIRDNGGAYTMVTQGFFKDFHKESLPATRVTQGPLYSSIWQTVSPQLSYSITVINSTDQLAQSLQIDVFTNVSSMPGKTFFMNLHTPIQNGARFYTDVNGLYLIERSYDRTLKLEANIYPMASQVMIEDDDLRCTVIGAQPTGVTATTGMIMLMIDREIVQDDGKGLYYPEAGESHPAHLKYRILFESKQQQTDNERSSKNEAKNSKKDSILYHSQFVQQNLEELLYPADLFVPTNTNDAYYDDASLLPAVLSPLPDNIQIISARYIASNKILISMRKLPYDCSTKPRLKCNSDMNLIEQFFNSFQGSIYLSNLTGTKTGNQISPQSIPNYFAQPLHIVTFLIKLN